MKKLYLITGFLGAGKTTFINNLLKDGSDKTAVIVNEFGEQGIDGALISQNGGIRIEEINNGSIFCCCRMMDFANALVKMAQLDVETVFVEASGLADPSNLEDIVEGANSRCGGEYAFAGSICIVDAVNFLKLSTALPALVSQVEHSNYVLINKSDLAGDDIVLQNEKRLGEINPAAKIYRTVNAKLPELPGEILELKPSSPSANTPTTRPKTKIIHPRPMYEKGLMRLIEKVSKKAYRAKGFITLGGEKKYLDIVNGTYSVSPADGKSEDKLVLLTLPKKN